jgi:hypothetical protein
VLNGADTGAPKVDAAVTENAQAFEVTLTHPTLGSAVVKLQKGPLSAGGSVAYAATGAPTAFQDLTTFVSNVTVTDDGPVWTPGSNVVAGLGEDELTFNGVNLTVYPNPAQSTLNIAATFSEEYDPLSPVNVSIYNLQGKIIESFNNVKVSKSGEIALTWDTKNVPAGLYSVVMYYDNRSVHKKVVVKK